jgi:hypothetical protein
MGIFDWLAKPKPTPVPSVVLKNVLGEVLLEILGRHDLIGANLAGQSGPCGSQRYESRWCQLGRREPIRSATGPHIFLQSNSTQRGTVIQ